MEARRSGDGRLEEVCIGRAQFATRDGDEKVRQR